MRVLAVAQGLDPLQLEHETVRERQQRVLGQAGPGLEPLAGSVEAARQLARDPGVVGGRVAERVDGERRAQGRGQRTCGEPVEEPGVPRRVGDDRHRGVVLGRRPDEARSADVNLLDQLVERDPGPFERRRERVQVDHDELERRDPGGGQLVAMVRPTPIREDPGMDPRVEGLHPAIEHLRGAGDRRDVRHRQPRPAQRGRRATGRDELEAETGQTAGEIDQTGLVRDRQERPARDGQPVRGAPRVELQPAVADRDRPGQEGGGRGRQEPVLDRLDPGAQRRLVVARQDRGCLLGDDRAAVEDLVDEMDRGARDRDPGRQRVPNRVRARECRQQRRMRVEDPATVTGEHARPDDPHVTGEDDRRRSDRIERPGEGLVVAVGDDDRRDPMPRRPVDGRAGSVGEHERDLRPERAPVRRGGERPQVRARARDPDGDARAAGRARHGAISSGPSA